MGIFSKIFGRKAADTEKKIGGMEDFMTLIRVYFQAVMAADLGITNLNALPDLRVFKTTLRVPTQGGKLGIGEKARCKKMLKQDSGCADISASVPGFCAGCDDAFRQPDEVQASSSQFL